MLRHDGANLSVETVVEQSDKLLDRLNRIEFPVAVAAIEASDRGLRVVLGELRGVTDKSRKLNSNQASRLHDAVGNVETGMFAEAMTKRLYLIGETRFNLDGLLEKPAMMFTSGTYVRLPQIARQDITPGFQCLAFDQPTATAFHILRATEAVLKQYYFALVKRNRLQVPMWGPILDALTKRKKRDEKLLARLRYIKDSFRNPTSHPEAIYSFHEAQDLIGICIDVINRMAAVLPTGRVPKITNEGSQPTQQTGGTV